jgi:cystathionine beta-lyase/cystathionine gamma-synthase
MHIYSQNINLKDILKDAYSKRSDLSIIKDEKLSYIVPEYIRFVDTTQSGKKPYTFDISYYNKTSFEEQLKKAHQATVVCVFYDELANNSMKLTIDISKTKDDQYFGAFKFFVFVDKRQVKLIYNKTKGLWEYASLLKIYDEPKVGPN